MNNALNTINPPDFSISGELRVIEKLIGLVFAYGLDNRVGKGFEAF